MKQQDTKRGWKKWKTSVKLLISGKQFIIIVCKFLYFIFRELTPISLISSSRWLVKRVKCTKISWKENPEKLTFGKRVNKQNLVLFLFTDLLLICKKKRSNSSLNLKCLSKWFFFSDERFAVVDYSHRNMVEVSELESSQGIPGLGEHSGFPAWLTLLQNHEHKTQEMLISFNSEADRFRWIELISPVISKVSNKFIYYVQS